MMKEKTLDIIVGVVLLALVVAGLSYVTVKLAGIADPTDDRPIVEGAITPVEKNGRWVVPSDQVPDDADALLVGPSLAMIPDRREDPPANSEKVPSKDRSMIANTIAGFLGEWETFNPSQITIAESENKRNPYESRLGRYVTPNSLKSIASREDATDPSGVCVECNAGLTWMGAGDLGSSTRLNDYDGTRVYAAASGIVKYTSPPVQLNPRNGELISRSYGLILKKEGKKWLVERAAAGEGQPVGG